MITDTQTKLRRLTGAMLSAAVLGLFVNGAAFAQETSGDVFEEIVVLAQKRAQNIMDVPVAVSAVTARK